MFDLKLGSNNLTVEIVQYDRKNIKFDDNTESDKIVLETVTPDGNKFNIDEVWIKQKEQVTTRGLWITLDNDGNILGNSTLGKFLNFMKVDSLNALVGRKITLTPKETGFMAAKAYYE